MKSTVVLKAKIAMLSATLIWGSSFIIIEDLVDKFPTNALLAIRFIFSALLLSVIFFKNMKNIATGDIWRGAVLGCLLFLAYMFQTFGISFPDNTPGKNAFLTAVYVVIVPFFARIFTKNSLSIYNVCSAFLCIIGIGLVSLTESFAMGIGDALTLVCGIFYALHMVAVPKFSKERDPIVLTVVQFATSGILALLVSLLTELDSVAKFTPTVTSLMQIGYLTVFCTAIALTFQVFGQKYTEPSTASVIFSLESVFGVAFSIILGGESPSVRVIIGFVLIFIAVIVSETKLSFLKSKKNVSST